METLKQIATQMGLDETFYSLFGLVVALYAILSLTYLKPYQRLLRHRREKTEGAKKEAQDLLLQADEKMSQYRARLKETNEKARQVLRENEEAAKREEAKLLGEAGAKAKAALQGAQKELDAQQKAILDALSGEISGIAGEIATKVMGRPVSAR